MYLFQKNLLTRQLQKIWQLVIELNNMQNVAEVILVKLKQANGPRDSAWNSAKNQFFYWIQK